MFDSSDQGCLIHEARKWQFDAAGVDGVLHSRYIDLIGESLSEAGRGFVAKGDVLTNRFHENHS
jgi:hypothetical protein